jgi:hypothetical protein
MIPADMQTLIARVVARLDEQAALFTGTITGIPPPSPAPPTTPSRFLIGWSQVRPLPGVPFICLSLVEFVAIHSGLVLQ